MRSESFSRPWNQSSSRRSSRFTLRNQFGHWGSSTSTPQLPPLNFGGEEDTFWPTSQIISPEPSSPVSEQSSLYSPRRSVVSTLEGQRVHKCLARKRSLAGPTSTITMVFSLECGWLVRASVSSGSCFDHTSKHVEVCWTASCHHKNNNRGLDSLPITNI